MNPETESDPDGRLYWQPQEQTPPAHPGTPQPQPGTPPVPGQPYPQPYFPPQGQQYPQPPFPQPGQPYPMPRSRGRLYAILACAAVVVLALGAGVTVWLTGAESSSKKAGFDRALTDLTSAPGLRYVTTSRDQPTTKWDVTVTTSGDVVGTVNQGGQDTSVIRVDGTTYFDPPDDPAKPASKGKWQTGITEFDDEMAGFTAPKDLATILEKAVNAAFDRSADTSAGSVDGTPAIKVETDDGTFYISESEPHRVLRWIPSDLATGDTLGMFSSIDFFLIANDRVNAMYTTLRDNVGKLGGAVDASLQLNAAGEGNVSCSNAGCSITQAFTGTVSGGVRGGRSQAVATISATFTVEDKFAGTCTASGTYPFTANTFSGSLSCTSPAAGGVFASIRAGQEADADRRAQAERRTISFQTRFAANYDLYAEAVSQAEVTRLLDQIEKNRPR